MIPAGGMRPSPAPSGGGLGWGCAPAPSGGGLGWGCVSPLSRTWDRGRDGRVPYWLSHTAIPAPLPASPRWGEEMRG
jgi:hypothetical protein